MPIKELRDLSRPRSAGRLRLGTKTPDGRPQRSEFFIFDPLDSGLAAMFRQMYGDKATSLDVVLPQEELVLDGRGQVDPEASAQATIDLVFPQWRRYWRQSKPKLFCEGDGEKASRATNKPKVRQTIECGDQCQFWIAGQCKYEGNLSVRLWRLPTLDLFQVRARLLSIIRLNSDIKQLFLAFGRAAGLPLRLFLTPYEAEQGTVQVINLAVESQTEQIEEFNVICPSMALPALAATNAALALPPSHDSSPVPVPETQAVEQAPVVEEPPPYSPPLSSQVSIRDQLNAWSTPPPEELSHNPDESNKIAATVNVIASLDESDDQYDGIALVLMGLDPQRPRTLEQLYKVWAYMYSNAKPEPANPLADDQVEAAYKEASGLRPSDLSNDPVEGHRVCLALGIVRLGIVPHIADAKEKHEVMRICLGRSLMRERTLTVLEIIQDYYQGKVGPDGRRTGGALKTKEEEE